ncbi:DUF664 domain-containing protein [bacterium]|nr:MAG: DUF664 domain-containing protein [bacterium]
MDGDLLLKALDTAHWELSEALRDLPDEDVWTRPDPRLLSVGELVAHVAYWEARSFFGDAFESPLLAGAARYYISNIDAPLRLPLTIGEMWGETERIHEAAKAAFLALSPNLDAKNHYRQDWTWAATLEYQAFHVAYHTGQIYSARHLLGHQTVDN